MLDEATANDSLQKIELCAYLLRGPCTPAKRARYLELLGRHQRQLATGATLGADAEGDSSTKRRAGRKGVVDDRTQHESAGSSGN